MAEGDQHSDDVTSVWLPTKTKADDWEWIGSDMFYDKKKSEGEGLGEGEGGGLHFVLGRKKEQEKKKRKKGGRKERQEKEREAWGRE